MHASLHQPATRMPALFIGHGSPMNALEDNIYTRKWQQLGASILRPKAIVVVSAHWTTQGVAVTAMAAPPTIHDFGGFPQALFEVQYPAPGAPELAQRVHDLLAPLEVRLDQDWGLDHGAWSVLVRMYPQADVPVIQISIDATRPDAWHLALGRRLAPLRDEGVLILGSGSVVHNLRAMRWSSSDPYDWATRFNDAVRECLVRGDAERLADYARWPDAALSVPTPEHFQPLLYLAGVRQDDERIDIVVDGIEMGAISMLSAAVGNSA